MPFFLGAHILLCHKLLSSLRARSKIDTAIDASFSLMLLRGVSKAVLAPWHLEFSSNRKISVSVPHPGQQGHDACVDSVTHEPGFVEMRARLPVLCQRDADWEPDDDPAVEDPSAPASPGPTPPWHWGRKRPQTRRRARVEHHLLRVAREGPERARAESKIRAKFSAGVFRAGAARSKFASRMPGEARCAIFTQNTFDLSQLGNSAANKCFTC
jgi:hypothetical protein